MRPVQNLNGYEYPWVGGAGKNRLPILSAASSTQHGVTWTNNNDGSWTVNGTASGGNSYLGNGTFTYSLGILPAGDYIACIYNADKVTVNNDIVTCRVGKGSASSLVVSGNSTAVFTADGTSEYYFSAVVTNGKTVDNLAVFLSLEPGSTPAAKWSPYENICPIYGHIGARVARTGENALPPEEYSGSGVMCSITSELKMLINSTNTSAAYIDFYTNFDSSKFAGWKISGYDDSSEVPISAAGIYFGLWGKNSDGTVNRADRRALFNANDSEISDVGNGLVLSLRIAGNAGLINYVLSPMLSKLGGSFKGFAGNFYPVSWQDEAGIVYGGNIDFTSGVLTVTMAQIVSYNGEVINEPWISDRDRYIAGTTPSIGAQVVYPLTTPIVYQLTPQEITTLLGTNNIWVETEINS